MKEHALFEVIGETDEELLAASERPKRRMSWMRLGTIGACAVLLLAVTLPFAKRTYEDIRLRMSGEDVKIQRVYGMDMEYVEKYVGEKESYTYNYTPAELLAKNSDIVWGKITRMDTFKMERTVVGNTKLTSYYTRMTIRVKQVYRGDASKWEKIEVLLPRGYYGERENVISSADGTVLGKLEKGREGIFLLSAYKETDYVSYGDEKIKLCDFADYRLSDGRWCILQDENEILAEKMWEDVLSACETLEDVGDWFSEQIK